jgi:uncharacterized membrane protein
MQEHQIKELWQASNAKLEQKLVTLLIGILWVGFGGVLLVNLFVHAFDKTSPFFLFSAALQLLITAIALIIYSYQTVLIYQADISDTIIATQKKLTHLKSSSIWLARLLFLQLPLWTIFYWNKTMLQNGNIILWIVQIIVTISFTVVGVWLFFNINYKNKDKKWFQLLFSGKEWKPIIKAMELNKELADFAQKN